MEEIFYTKQRQLMHYEAHLVVALFVGLGVWFIVQSIQNHSIPILFIFLIYIPVAIYCSAWFYALVDTCLMIFPTGIEYRRPECRVQATWDQVNLMKRSTFGAMLGISYYLYLDAPVVKFSKWFGFSYRPLYVLFPSFYTRIPLGKGLWESSDELMKEVRARIADHALGLDQIAGKRA